MNEQQIIETLATKVMGWSISFQGDMHDENYNPTGHIAEWNPLQNIADAWQVVKKLESLGWLYDLYNTRGREYYCRFGGNPEKFGTFAGEGKTEQEAICNAAYQLVA